MKNLIFFIFEKSYSKKLGFVLQTDKAFNSIFAFVKEDGLTFLCLKEKLQKKQASPSLDPLSDLWFEAMKPLRKSLRLGAELFACQNLWWVLDGFLFFVRLGQATELFGWVCRQNLSHPNSLF